MISNDEGELLRILGSLEYRESVRPLDGVVHGKEAVDGRRTKSNRLSR